LKPRRKDEAKKKQLARQSFGTTLPLVEIPLFSAFLQADSVGQVVGPPSGQIFFVYDPPAGRALLTKNPFLALRAQDKEEPQISQVQLPLFCAPIGTQEACFASYWAETAQYAVMPTIPPSWQKFSRFLKESLSASVACSLG